MGLTDCSETICLLVVKHIIFGHDVWLSTMSNTKVIIMIFFIAERYLGPMVNESQIYDALVIGFAVRVFFGQRTETVESIYRINNLCTIQHNSGLKVIDVIVN